MWRLLVVSLALGLALAGSAAARAPSNDAFAAAIVLTGEAGSIAGSNMDATRERDEPDDGGDEGEGGSVWYRWTAPSSGPFVFRTCRRDFDTLLNVYTGSNVADLARVARNDDGCGIGSAVALPAVAGTVYSIAVSTFGGRAGSFVLEWEAAEPPGNDAFAAPIVLAGRSGTAAATMRFATREAAEPSHGGGAGSVWFTWTPPEGGVVRLSASRELGLGVYLGDALPSLRVVRLVNAETHSLAFEALAGTTYRIVVAGAVPAFGGDFRVDWARAPEPVNDAFDQPYMLSGERGATTASLLASTFETGEPTHGSVSATGSVWFAWRADRAQRMAFTVCPQGAAVSAALYVGETLHSLGRLDTITGTCRNSGRIAFDAIPGTAYRIAIAGPRVTTGSITLSWSTPPANDDLANAREIGGEAASIEGTTVGSTRESGEGEHRANGVATVWYAWTATTSGLFAVDTCRESVDADVALYTGTDWGTLQPVAAENSPTCDNSGSAVRFRSVAGTTYRVAVVSTSETLGAFNLRLRPSPVPANDTFANALRLTGATGTVSATTIGATREPREPRANDSPAGSVWFRWSAPRDMWVQFDTCASAEGDTVLAVYEGRSVAHLRRIAVAETECYPHRRAALRVKGGREYRILVSHLVDAADFTLRWGATTPPDCRVPYVVGMKVSAARALISLRSCRAEVRRVASQLVKRGLVIAQRPEGGRRGPHGAIVRIEVASG